MIELTLPYPPSTNRMWRSYVPKGWSRAVVCQTEEAKAYKRTVGWLAKAAGIRSPLLGRISVEFTLHPKRPKDWERRQRKNPAGWEDSVQCLDLDNAQKVLFDACRCILFADDAWVREIHARRGEPRSEPCVVLRVATIDSGLFAEAA